MVDSGIGPARAACAARSMIVLIDDLVVLANQRSRDKSISKVVSTAGELTFVAMPLISWLERTAPTYADLTKRRLYLVADGRGRDVGEWVAVSLLFRQELERLAEEFEAISVPLTENDRWILEAMLSLNATVVNAQSASVIVKAALCKGDAKRAFKNLIANSLVNSKTGRGGGYWLTEKGLQVAQSLKE